MSAQLAPYLPLVSVMLTSTVPCLALMAALAQEAADGAHVRHHLSMKAVMDIVHLDSEYRSGEGT